MPVLLALLAILMTVPPAAAEQARGARAVDPVRVDNAQDLVRACRGIDAGTRAAGRRTTIPVSNGMLVCLGYMQAMQDFAVLADKDGTRLLGACTPADTTLKQIVRSFIKYSEAHRDELKGSAAVVVVQSLRDAFPCDSTSTVRDLDGRQ